MPLGYHSCPANPAGSASRTSVQCKHPHCQPLHGTGVSLAHTSRYTYISLSLHHGPRSTALLQPSLQSTSVTLAPPPLGQGHGAPRKPSVGEPQLQEVPPLRAPPPLGLGHGAPRKPSVGEPQLQEVPPLRAPPPLGLGHGAPRKPSVGEPQLQEVLSALQFQGSSVSRAPQLMSPTAPRGSAVHCYSKELVPHNTP